MGMSAEEQTSYTKLDKFSEFDRMIPLQLDLYSTPTKDAYRNKLNIIMHQINDISGMEDIIAKNGALKKEKFDIGTDLNRYLSGWRVKNEQRIKANPLNTEQKELSLEIRELKQKLDGGGLHKYESETDPKKREDLEKQIKKIQKKRTRILTLIKNDPIYKKYFQDMERIDKRILKLEPHIEKFYFEFVDSVNEKLERIGKEGNYHELYLNGDLTFQVMKKEEHMANIDGRIFTFPFKAYKFEDLPDDDKNKIIKTLKTEFNKVYLTK